MEMSLQTVKICLLNVSIEQTDCRSLHNIILWLTFHYHLELLSCFLVFSLGFGIDLGVLDIKTVIFVVLEDFYRCVKIDRCSFHTETGAVVGVARCREEYILALRVGLLVLIKLLIETLEVAWPIIDRVIAIFSEVLFKHVSVIFGTVWHTPDDRHSICIFLVSHPVATVAC